MYVTQTAAIVGILLLATLTESLVEYLVAPWFTKEDGTKEDRWPGIVLRYIAAAVGIALCAVYRADLLAMLGLTSPWPWVGWVVTGVIIGRGANFVHDFATRWQSAQTR